MTAVFLMAVAKLAHWIPESDKTLEPRGRHAQPQGNRIPSKACLAMENRVL